MGTPETPHPDLALLQRHAPKLFLDPLERFAPVAVDAFAAAAATFAGDRRLADPPADLAHDDGCPAGLHLDPVPSPPGARAGAVFERFAPAPGPTAWRCYGAILPLGRRRVLQYWCFYADNPFGLRIDDIGRHVADWEQVQVELSGEGAIAAVTVFQHGSPQRVAVGAPALTIEDAHPHVFVAEGSHAMYLTAGSQPRILKRDNTSAAGRHGIPVVLPLPAEPGTWATWCGRWGPDTGPQLPGGLLRIAHWLVHKSLGGDSPPSPLGPSRSRVERTPARARAAGRVQPVNRIGRLLRWLGQLTWPSEVEVDDGEHAVAVDGRTVRLRVLTDGSVLRIARYVDATVIDAQGAAIGHARVPFAPNRTADLMVELVAAAGAPVAVRVAGYNLLDQRGDVRCVELAPA
jgi:hypothetical protein